MEIKDPKLRITVLSVKGSCRLGHKAGDVIETPGDLTPPNFCGFAYHSMYPVIKTIIYGGKVPYARENGMVPAGCPDEMNKVVFGISKIEEKV